MYTGCIPVLDPRNTQIDFIALFFRLVKVESLFQVTTPGRIVPDHGQTRRAEENLFL
jgi:hypothetical protein